MSDNSQPHHDSTSKQDPGLLGRDLGEAIYARHAQFVWPTSITSSLARRFAPFTEKRLPLAGSLQRKWSVAHSSLSRWPDLQWLQAFGPGGPRHAVAARQYEASIIPSSTSASALISPTPAIARIVEAESSLTPDHTVEPSINLSEHRAPSSGTGAATQAFASAPRSSAIAREVTGPSVSDTSNRVQLPSSSSATPLTHHLEADIFRAATSHAIPVPRNRKHVAVTRADRVVQHESLAPRVNQGERVFTPESPSLPANAGARSIVSPSTPAGNSNAPITVYNAPPIIRRSLASRQAGTNRADSLARQISASSNNFHETAAQKSDDSILPATSVRGTPHSSNLDGIISSSKESPPQSSLSYSAAQPIALEQHAIELRQIDTSSASPASVAREAETRQTTHSSLRGAVDRRLNLPDIRSASSSSPAAPSQIVSSEIATNHGSTLMTHATPSTYAPSTAHNSPPTSAVRSLASRARQFFRGGYAVAQDISRSQPTNEPELRASHEESSAPLTATGPSYNRFHPAESETEPVAERSAVDAAAQVHAIAFASNARFLMFDKGGPLPAGKTEPAFRSGGAILRSAGNGYSAARMSERGVISATTVVVQESATANSIHTEPLVFSRAVIASGALQRLSGPSSNSSIQLAASPSGGVIATQNTGFMQRSGPASATVARFANLSVARQAADGPSIANAQLPTLPSAAANTSSNPQMGAASPDITQLANRVYDVLVRRLASERQRRGR
jgi:hypothetical protein